ncbi:hypothetical protein QF000_000711 [Paraburkholderia atlantica]|uniref:Uncharacterized protein n=2 Tax=Paraburkholderia TaxID=1822464 RepID=A0A7W8LHQ5_9BURK|nr:hypothetical protein [Paraburkholderia youngii]MBB5421396.1 hypothetical protein [Paraburkholderia atlantica]MBB5429460.1 hypothetical protein [Paraburkholderia atlantica]
MVQSELVRCRECPATLLLSFTTAAQFLSELQRPEVWLVCQGFLDGATFWRDRRSYAILIPRLSFSPVTPDCVGASLTFQKM